MAESAKLSVKNTETKRENKASQPQKTSPSQSINSPVEQILSLQRTIGNQAVGRLLKSGALQAKLKIGQPGDVYEQEADRVAEQVIKMPEPKVSNETKVAYPARNNPIQRKYPGCKKGTKIGKEEEEEKLQKKEASGSAHEVTPELESSINAVCGGGQPLPESVRAFYEPRFGQDFSGVRVHTDGRAAEAAQGVDARAFTVGKNVVFGEGEYAPGMSKGNKLLAHELTHVVQQDRISIRRKKGGGTDTSNTSKSDVGIAEGETKTPSDQTNISSDYKERKDGNFDTSDSRIISREQALAESQVINSEGIFMGAYLARYNALKGKYMLPQDVIDKLSKKAGFMKQFKTGDIVLRQMNAEDSRGLAKITDSNYSHSGIIQVNDGRVWILDSYPAQKKTGRPGDRVESTVLIRFEDFFGDQHGEQITQGIVLRITGMTESIRANINSLINYYNVKPTTFDYEFKVDNDQFSLYCSELVWRILKEASSMVLPPNEFEFTKNMVITLIAQLEALITFQKSQGTDTNKSESQLVLLKSKLKDFETATTKELYSPGSLERTPGLEPVTGFTREGKIEGEFEVIIVSGKVPNDSWDTPDPYVILSGGLLGKSGKTSVKSDTITPAWDETIAKFEYEALRSVTLELYDEDVLSDDHLATFTGDLRPVNPKGQTFVLSDAGSILKVMVKGVNEGKTKGAFGPQAPRNEPIP